jgi:hypothetical protein
MSKVASFFEQYRMALAASDIKVIASAYGDHFLISGSSGQQYVKNGRGFRASLRKSAKFYQQMGVANVKVTKFNCSVLDKHHAGVEVEWQLVDRDGQELIRHDVSYVIYVSHKGIQIIFFIAHNEEERWHERGFI